MQIEITVCKMKPSARGSFRRDGPFIALDLCVNDSYKEVAKKAGSVLKVSSTPNLRLFRTRGAIIPFTSDWTIGKYKRKLRLGPERIQLGVAPVPYEQPQKVSTEQYYIVLL